MSGEIERDEAIARVDANAKDEWKSKMSDCMRWLNTAQETWTIDDARALMEDNYPDVKTHDNRAIGALIVAMKRAGEIVEYGEVKSARPTRHRARLAVYGKPRGDADILRMRSVIQSLRRDERYDDELLAKALVQKGVKVA